MKYLRLLSCGYLFYLTISCANSRFTSSYYSANPPNVLDVIAELNFLGGKLNDSKYYEQYIAEKIFIRKNRWNFKNKQYEFVGIESNYDLSPKDIAEKINEVRKNRDTRCLSVGILVFSVGGSQYHTTSTWYNAGKSTTYTLHASLYGYLVCDDDDDVKDLSQTEFYDYTYVNYRLDWRYCETKIAGWGYKDILRIEEEMIKKFKSKTYNLLAQDGLLHKAEAKN